MFKINDTVVHKGMGICTIIDITEMAVGNNPKKSFYVLKPIYENSSTKIYMPIENDNLLRHPLNPQKIKEIISKAKKSETLWNNNDSLRKNIFIEILKNDNYVKIIKLIYELREKKNEMEINGKKLHSADEKILGELERLVHSELAHSLNIDLENVSEYIFSQFTED